jgi:hypothetical protein
MTISSGYVRGAHIQSGTAVSTSLPVPSFTYSDSLYDHNESLVGNEELQIYNGKFRTSINGYANYSTSYGNSGRDYTSLNTVNGYRFATFQWNITEMQAQVSSLFFMIQGISPGSLAYSNTLYTTLFSGTTTPLLLFYRFVEVDGSIPGDGYIPSNVDKYTTIWLNGNSKLSPVVNQYTYASPTDNTVIQNGLVSVSDGGTTYTVNVTVPFNSNRPVKLFCRIGIPMNINFEFSHVSARVS